MLVALCTNRRVELFASVSEAISMWESEEHATVEVCVLDIHNVRRR